MKLKYLLRGIGIGIFAAGLVAFLVNLGGGKISDEKAIARAVELGYEKEEDILARLNSSSEIVKLTDETPSNSTKTSEKSIAEEIIPDGLKTSEEPASEEQTTSEEDSAKKTAEEDEKKKAEEESAKKAAEEEEKKKAEEEAAKKAAEEAEKKKAEEEAAKKAAEEAEKKKAEEEAAKKAAEEAEKKKAEEEAAKKEAEKKEATGEVVNIVVKSGQYSDSVAKACKDAGLVEDATKFDKFLCDNGYSGRISVGDHKIAKGSSEEEIAKALCR